MNEYTPEGLIEYLGHLVNYNTVNKKLAAAMVTALNGEHRTLQQQAIHLMIRTLIEYGHQDVRFIDGRNEYAWRMCKRLGELADANEFIPYMPLI